MDFRMCNQVTLITIVPLNEFDNNERRDLCAMGIQLANAIQSTSRVVAQVESS
jgi:hypothetical protein